MQLLTEDDFRNFKVWLVCQKFVIIEQEVDQGVTGMHNGIIQMQKYLTELDRYIVSGDMDGFQSGIKNIRLMCDHLESTFKEDIEHHKRSQARFHSRYKRVFLNEVTFLVKSVAVTNAYNDDYLENFVKVRSDQLETANAMDGHNEFWMNYSVIHGNVFGSVPMELIQRASIEKLKSFGWKEITVSVYDFGKELERTMAFYEYCDLEFGNYIIVKEVETESYLLLKYHL